MVLVEPIPKDLECVPIGLHTGVFRVVVVEINRILVRKESGSGPVILKRVTGYLSEVVTE